MKDLQVLRFNHSLDIINILIAEITISKIHFSFLQVSKIMELFNIKLEIKMKEKIIQLMLFRSRIIQILKTYILTHLIHHLK
jgi:hypothetical protein